MTIFRFLTIVILSLSLGASSLEAGLVSHDLFNPGDGLVTYDDVNQREWLDLEVSANYPPSELLIAIEPGGDLEGFQFAREEDVNQLLRLLEVPGSPNAPGIRYVGQEDIISYEVDAAVIDFFGWIYNSSGLGDSISITSGIVETDTGEQLGNHHFDGSFTTIHTLYYDESGITTNPGEPTEYTGLDVPFDPYSYVFTVRDSSFSLGLDPVPFWLYREAILVPEPATLGFALLASFATFLCPRRSAH